MQCDEVHPRCSNCVKHGVACDFEHPEVADEPQTSLASPSNDAPTPFTPILDDFNAPLQAADPQPPSSLLTPLCRPPASPQVSPSTPSAAGRLMELRLMHHFTLMTCRTLAISAPSTEAIWRTTVPQIAFAGSQHLTDAILAVAALHLRSLSPDDKSLIRASHAYMASSLREYNETLKRVDMSPETAEALFLTSTLIAFQSTATRIFNKDELSLRNSAAEGGDGAAGGRKPNPAGGYALPLSWFHAFQGVKTVTAVCWPHIRKSEVVTNIIDSQPVLQLDFQAGTTGFFGHLLDGLDGELAALTPSAQSAASAAVAAVPEGGPGDDVVQSTRQAYLHAVAVLNWAHKIPHKGAPLAFPATVSRRFVELLEVRQPRALAILACFFALLKSLDNVWWLQGMARREVLGVVSLFNSDYFDPAVERRWWPHLEWAVLVALYEAGSTGTGNSGGDGPSFIPPEIWGTNWLDEECIKSQRGNESFVSHIELLSKIHSAQESVPNVPPEQ